MADHRQAAGGGAWQAVIFDIGGVLVDWNPRYLYRRLFGDAAAMEAFLATICTPSWNLSLDAGLPFAAAVADLARRHPAYAAVIAAYDHRWPDMVAGPIRPVVRLLHRLAAAGVRLYALTNFSAEKFPLMKERFDFMRLFAGAVVSGEEGVVKPDPEIYRRLLARYRLDPDRCLFIDDNEANVAGATAVGLDAIRFTDAAALERALIDRGLLAPPPPLNDGLRLATSSRNPRGSPPPAPSTAGCRHRDSRRSR